MRVVSLLRASNPGVRLLACELVLELARRSQPAPAPAPASKISATGAGSKVKHTHDIAKSIIGAGGLGALWNACCFSSGGSSLNAQQPVALAALAALLGTAAAMNRSSASSTAVLALVSEGAVGRLAREYVDPALATLAEISIPEAKRKDESGKGTRGPPLPPPPPSPTVTVATSALLALHFLAVNPDPAVYGLFLVVAGVDFSTTTGAVSSGSGGGSSAWNMIISSTEAASNGRAGPAFLEAALLAAGSVCGAPPLPPTVRRSRDGSDESSSFAGDVARVLPVYQARTQKIECLAAAASATARGLAAWAVSLLTEVGGATSSPFNNGFLMQGRKLAINAGDSLVVGPMSSSLKNGRAAIRLVWALSQGPSSVSLGVHGAIPRLMDLVSDRRERWGGTGLADDPASGVLVLETIGSFLSQEDGNISASSRNSRSGVGSSAVPPLSPNIAATAKRAVEELCGLVLDGNGAARENNVVRAIVTATDFEVLGLRSLTLLAEAAGNSRFRPLVVSSPRFAALLDLLLFSCSHLDGASSVRILTVVVAVAAIDAVVLGCRGC